MHRDTSLLEANQGVVVVGASPDRINRNAVMRRFVAEGLAEVLGSSRVAECSFDDAPRLVGSTLPKLVVCFGSCMPDVCNYGPLRDACDRVGAGLAFWLHDDPYEFDFSYRAVHVADWIFSNDSWAAVHYEHPRASFLPMAASPTAHWRSDSQPKDRDVFFCGVGFSNRIQLFTDLSPILQQVRTDVLGADWPDSLPFARNQRITNAEWTDACSRSLVTVNVGRNLHLANQRFQLDPSTPGPRTFEAALAGTVQMYHVDSLEIAQFFKPGQEVLLFDDPRSFSDQLMRLIDDPAHAHAIAGAAQRRALRDHTYAARGRRLLAQCGWDLGEPADLRA